MAIKTKRPAAGEQNRACKKILQLQHNPIIDTGQDLDGNSAAVQRQRIFNYLRSGKALTTLEARATLDVLHPAARIMELRRQGWNIETVWTNDLSQAGKIHRVARYILSNEDRDE